jgi:hypothetical protein
MERHLIPFHDHSILVVEDDQGTMHVPMKPLVERLGLSWQVQHRKLTAPDSGWGVAFMVIPSGGGMQEMLCLPAAQVPRWVATLTPSRVRPALRDLIRRYQREVDEVLFAWVSGKKAAEVQALADRAEAAEQTVGTLREMLLAEKPFWSKIDRYRRMGWHPGAIAIVTRRSVYDVREIISTLEQVGVLEPPSAPVAPAEVPADV